MSKIIISFLFVFIAGYLFYFGNPISQEKFTSKPNHSNTEITELKKLSLKMQEAKSFCKKNSLNTSIIFMLDMCLNSGKYRFFVYDMLKDSVTHSGLVAHGSCQEFFLKDVTFSNISGSGCSALGKYKIGNKYTGKFGLAYKLHGLEETNSNAFARNIVLHSYYLVPDKETDPLPICNSLGCAMVSDKYLKLLSKEIDNSSKPILLWMFE